MLGKKTSAKWLLRYLKPNITLVKLDETEWMFMIFYLGNMYKHVYKRKVYTIYAYHCFLVHVSTIKWQFNLVWHNSPKLWQNICDM